METGNANGEQAGILQSELPPIPKLTPITTRQLAEALNQTNAEPWEKGSDVLEIEVDVQTRNEMQTEQTREVLTQKDVSLSAADSRKTASQKAQRIPVQVITSEEKLDQTIMAVGKLADRLKCC